MGDSIHFWFKFAFSNQVSVTGTVKFFDSKGHELANYALQAVPTILNDNAGDKLVFNAAEGEFVRSWNKVSDEVSCGPLGVDSSSALTWATTDGYQAGGSYTANWKILSNPALGLTGNDKTLGGGDALTSVTCAGEENGYTLSCNIGAEGDFDEDSDWAVSWTLSGWALPSERVYNSRSPRPVKD